ncbi:MAG: nucleotidyltransferase [Candidatus Zambryskibacteria bacterium]|nr:nucleotidyltransferase [Candidatus Zambryskibacteria bacterium]
MDKKFQSFLEIAKALNKHGIVPVLYGSLGLYRITGQLDKINDIDIIIPNKILINNLEELMRILAEVNYKQDASYPHEFTKGEGSVGFEPESDLIKLEIDIEKLKITEIDGVKFKELALKDYLLVYKRNQESQQKKLTSTKTKIEAIEKII